MKKSIINRLIKLELSMGLNEIRSTILIPNEVEEEIIRNGGHTDWEPDGGWPENPFVEVPEELTHEEWIKRYAPGGTLTVATDEEIDAWMKWNGYK